MALAAALTARQDNLADDGVVRKDDPLLAPVAAGGFAALCATLPDLIEPATSPHHRQFFHSLTFAAFLGAGLHQLWKYQPKSQLELWTRRAGLIAGGSYLVHLALDSTTPMGLPLVGR